MKDDFTLEDILEEERQKREARAGGQPTEEAPVIEYVPEEPGEECVPEEQTPGRNTCRRTLVRST